MRPYCYQLCIKHPLPQPMLNVTQNREGYSEPQIFHTILPVGTAVISANSEDPTLWLYLLDSPDALLWKILLTSFPVHDRGSFLSALETISNISNLLCYRVESAIESCVGDVSDILKYKHGITERSYHTASRALYLEIYARS